MGFPRGSKIQIQESLNRRRRRHHWINQPPGTKPKVYQEHKAFFQPMSATGMSGLDVFSLLAGLSWLMRRRGRRER